MNRLLVQLFPPSCTVQGGYEWIQCSGEISSFCNRRYGKFLLSKNDPKNYFHVSLQDVGIGSYRALLELGFFNRISDQCMLFDYGGCRRTENNFLTKEACEARYHPRKSNIAHSLSSTVNWRSLKEILTYPKISWSASLRTCKRSCIFENAKCAHPLAKCVWDPCACQARVSGTTASNIRMVLLIRNWAFVLAEPSTSKLSKLPCVSVLRKTAWMLRKWWLRTR